jgi:hypothetical protein
MLARCSPSWSGPGRVSADEVDAAPRPSTDPIRNEPRRRECACSGVERVAPLSLAARRSGSAPALTTGRTVGEPPEAPEKAREPGARPPRSFGGNGSDGDAASGSQLDDLAGFEEHGGLRFLSGLDHVAGLQGGPEGTIQHRVPPPHVHIPRHDGQDRGGIRRLLPPREATGARLSPDQRATPSDDPRALRRIPPPRRCPGARRVFPRTIGAEAAESLSQALWGMMPGLEGNVGRRGPACWRNAAPMKPWIWLWLTPPS